MRQSPEMGLVLRAFTRNPASPAATVTVLWVGIAITSSLFAVVDGLLFRPLPFDHPEMLVAIYQIGDPRDLTTRRPLSLPAYESLVARHDVFSGVGAFGEGDLDFAKARTQSQDPVSVQVTPSLAEVLRVTPFLGRPLRVEDERYTDPRSALIGYELWQSRLGGDASAIGRIVTLSERRFVVVGVMPRGFDFPLGANVWTAVAERRPQPERGYLHAVARLRPGVSARQAQAAVAGIGRRRSEVNAGPNFVIRALRDDLRPSGTSSVVFLFGAAVLVLLVGIAQVAGLQAARAAEKTHEMALRVSLGATFPHLVWPFALEGLVLAGLSLAAAWVVIPICVVGLVNLLPETLTRGQQLEPDLRTFTFSGITLFAAAVIFAAQASRQVAALPVWDALHSARRGVPLVGVVRTRATLVVVQCAATACLLYLGGMAVLSFVSMVRQDLGFSTRDTLVIRVPMEENLARDNAARRILASRVLESLRGLPGAVSVAGMSTAPLSTEAFFVRLRVSPQAADDKTVIEYWITPDYFKTIGATIIEGRDFSEVDEREGASLAIINETLAKSLRAARHSTTGYLCTIGCDTLVLGVVADICDQSPDIPARPQLYLLSSQGYAVSTFVVKVAPRARPSRADVQRALMRLGVKAPTVIWMDEEFAAVVAPAKARVVLLGVLGCSALLLSGIGVLGAMTYVMRLRRREIGIRLALGATPSDVRLRLLGMALRLAAVGTVSGLMLGTLGSQLLALVVPDIRPFDPLVALSVGMLLPFVASMATVLSMRGLSHVSPLNAIREE